MEQIYNNLTTKSYKLISTVCLILADVGVLVYLYFRFTDKEMFKKSMEIVMKAYPDAQGQLGPNFEAQLYQLMVNSLLTMLSAVLIYHIIIYFIWNKGNKFGHGYISLYTIVAAPGCILVGLSSLSSSFLNGLFWIVAGLLYLFVLMGLRTFKEPEKKRAI